MTETESHEATGVLNAYQRQLIEILEIPDSVLARHNVTDLHIAYAKYMAYIDAQSKMFQMIRDGEWDNDVKSPSGAELIGLFVAKSSWYAGYNVFPVVDNHPDMKSWLEGNSCIGNAELWGKDRTKYTFKDLKAYLMEKGDLDSEGKVKAKGKGKGKRKAAGSVSEGTSKRREKKKKDLQNEESSSESSS